MGRTKSPSTRRHIGRVAIYQHHGAWWLYCRRNGPAVRERIGADAAAAEIRASPLNAELAAEAAGQPAPLKERAPSTSITANGESDTAAAGLTVAALRQRFLEHHEHVLGSSMATVRNGHVNKRWVANLRLKINLSQNRHVIVFRK